MNRINVVPSLLARNRSPVMPLLQHTELPVVVSIVHYHCHNKMLSGRNSMVDAIPKQIFQHFLPGWESFHETEPVFLWSRHWQMRTSSIVAYSTARIQSTSCLPHNKNKQRTWRTATSQAHGHHQLFAIERANDITDGEPSKAIRTNLINQVSK